MKNTMENGSRFPITYFGYAEKMIITILNDPDFELKYVVTGKDKLSDACLKLLDVLNIPVDCVSDKEELTELKNKIPTEDIVMFIFGIIVPKEIWDSFRVFNIHPGDLKTNRGPFPHSRAILEGHTTTKAVIYRVDDKIDLGDVIGEYEVNIEETDSYMDLIRKVNEGLGELLRTIPKYKELHGKQIIEEGIYRGMLTDKELTINEEDTEDDIKRKIRACPSNMGAILKVGEYLYRVNGVKRIDSL